MKRIISFVICAIVIFGMTVGVFASTGFSVNITSDKDGAAAGDVVTLTISLSGTSSSRSGAIDVSLGESLELVSGEMLQSGAIMKDFTLSIKKGVVAFDYERSFDGEYAKLVLRVKEGTDRTVAVSVSLNPSGAENTAEFTIREPVTPSAVASIDTLTANAGDTVTLDVTLSGAPKIKSFALFALEYDKDALELIGAEWCVADAALADWNQDIGKGVAAFKNETDVNGKIFELTFKVKQDADSLIYPVSLNVTAKDMSGGDIEINSVPGAITVDKEVLPLWGDADGDGTVGMKDVLFIRKIIALIVEPSLERISFIDVNRDGYIDMKDVLAVMRMIAGN